MRVQIIIDGPGAADVARDLRDWLRQEGLAGVQADLEPGQVVTNTLGVGLATSLVLLLKASAATEAARSVGAWMKTRRPKVKLTFKSGTKQFTLETENVKIDDALVENLRSLLHDVA